ncbi:cation transporting ATPase C-terminal domain-containing protein [Puerhibacterium sp. TATVAM-FAB25]|uniref:cation transporting ATPase C-terminal domain-containing protein n=1 Tax=Puerhibacterium sp. TATVAM-FAB25 TaxID=3093699 RepID=UPI00397C93CB
MTRRSGTQAEPGAGESVPATESPQTTAVTMLAPGRLAYLSSCRCLHRSSLTPRVLRGDRAAWCAAAALVLLQAAFVDVPFLHGWFGSAPIGPREGLVSAGLAVVVLLLTEPVKALGRARERYASGPTAQDGTRA